MAVYTETGMDSDQMLAAAKRMEDIGGGFASCIGTAWIRADMDNRRKLLLGFAELFKRYHASRPYEVAERQSPAFRAKVSRDTMPTWKDR